MTKIVGYKTKQRRRSLHQRSQTTRELCRIAQEMKKSDEEIPNDGQCSVSYDIPEHIRYVRNKLLRFPKKAGFQMVQQSVWATKKNVMDDMKRFIEEIGLSDRVKVSISS
ncbi:CRISPR-associated endonuclease Cas2 [Patescibacteria group bacterium]|nr:CRISPR-associated endonuclease Cas2 [Patescibacteria group bacterium]MBU1906590.1 CRISPR-associated endonuclease Cas2 [Patescibacteria group bacterium]